MSLNIIPKPAKQRDLVASLDYTEDLKHDRAKVPVDDLGKMSGGLNFISADREIQIIEMQAHLNLSTHKDAEPLQHLVFSYASGIRPTRKQIEHHIQTYLETVGMSKSKVFYDCHENTDHFHVHVMLDRLSVTPDINGHYKIIDSGLVKKTSEEKRKNGKIRVRTRTDEASCRQTAIARICRTEGWTPPSLTHDAHGHEVSHTKKARPGRDGILSKSDRLAQIAWDVFNTSTSKLEPAERLAALGIKIQLTQKQGKIVGAKLVSKDATCSFSKMCPEQKGLYKKLSQKFALAPEDQHPAPANVTPFQAEDHLRTLMREVFAEPARFGASWDHLIGAVESHGARLERSGGGLIVVRDTAKVTTSSINNRYSLSKLEKVLGPCPIPKAASAAPPQPTARELLIRDARTILEKHVPKGHGLYWIKPDFAHSGIHITQKSFPNTAGQQQFYYAVERDNVSVPISSISKNKDNKPTYSMYLFEKLSKNDPVRSIDVMMEERRRQFEETNRRCSPGGDIYKQYMEDTPIHKVQRVEKLSFFAAVAKFLNFKHSEKENVYTHCSDTDQRRNNRRNTPQSQPLFTM